MVASPFGYIVLNVLYLLVFVLVFIIGIVFYMTDKKRLAQRIIAYPFAVLGILGAIFFAEVGIVSNIISLTIFFSVIYSILLFIGIYVIRWKPALNRRSDQ